MSPALLGLVVDHFRRHDVKFALIGAAAMAVHGVSRSTFDVDLLTVDPRVLDRAFWTPLGAQPAVRIEVRKGDVEDPLAGAVRVVAEGQRTVDVVVGRGEWQEQVIDGAEPATVQSIVLPVAGVADLILLKLFAAGAQDAWDIQQLLASDADGGVRAAVDRVEGRLPPDARRLWARIRAGR